MANTKDPPSHPDGARLDFAGAMSYGDYLGLDGLLAAQRPRSADHNEMLFIVQHQATELWMKLMVHELRAAIGHVRGDDLQPAFKMLSRVARIMAQLNQSWDVLATLTPAEYSSFRGDLGSSSGFQSYQYRMIEFLLGNKDAVAMEPHRHRPELFAALQELHRSPSLYDEAIRVLARRGFAIDKECVERDCKSLHAYNESVCFIGHSHYPGSFDRQNQQVRYSRHPDIKLEKGHRYLINVASIGQPRDGDPRAGYALYEDAERWVRHVRLDYDIAGAMRRILDAGLPRFLAERLQWGE